ncbi:MAG: PAAR domain-containing protein [Candidatus Competibacteraceae bacterium]|nr:PAAR domain-containing protein [Candidatus Competibacteraceae bacterium]
MSNFPTAPRAQPPQRPTNVLHDIANGISAVASAPMKGVELLNEGFATATQAISQALPAFPAATLGSVAIGLPHAHFAHPPSAPFAIPFPPIGPVTFGCSVQVLINGMPAARCGDLGLNPTCCGIPPIFEIFTGSSSVFIGGARAARMTDITYHCKPIPPSGAAGRGTAAAMKSAMNAAMVAQRAIAVGSKVATAAGMAAQGLMAAGDAIEAVETDDSAMSAALGMNAGMIAAQMSSDVVAMAMGAAMGKDPCAPPGTPGTITMGSPNVVIGGIPTPAWLAIAKGLLKMVKGLRMRRRVNSKKGKGKVGFPSCPPR